MSVAMVSMVLDCFPAGGALRCLAIALADAADDEGGGIYKSVATLAHQSVQSERTVQRVLPRLVAQGWLEVVQGGRGGRGLATVYRIAPAWITRCAVERARARLEGRRPARVELIGDGGDGAAGVMSEGGDVGGTKGDNMSPFYPVDKSVERGKKGDKNERKGDKNGQKGDSHGCHPNGNLERINPPIPPLTRGAVDVQRQTGASCGHARVDDGAERDRPEGAVEQAHGARPPWRWRETRSGVEAVGVQVGIGRWDEAAFGCGKGESFPVYRGRVIAAFERVQAMGRAAVATQAVDPQVLLHRAQRMRRAMAVAL